MNKKTKYKLVKTGKTVLATGLSLALITSAAIAGVVYKHSNGNDHLNSNTYVDSAVDDYLKVEFSNEKQVFSESKDITPIIIDKPFVDEFIELLNSYDYEFSMSKYYDIEENLNIYSSNSTYRKNENYEIITDGKLDSTKLYNLVLKNNDSYMKQDKLNINFSFEEASSNDIKEICDLIVNTYNKSEKYSNIGIIADTLSQLKIFKNETSTSNALITDEDFVLSFNPKMIEQFANMQEIIGNAEDDVNIKETVFVHEIEHMFQKASNDFNNNNGIETGFCRKYDSSNVNSLWYPWLLDGSAETKMSEILNTTPKNYGKKISYIRTYNLSRFFEENFKVTDLVNSAYTTDLESAFELLRITDDKSKLEFLELMYSIEITQSDTPDFYEFYEKQNNVSLTTEEKDAIRKNIRTEVVKKLSRNFYESLMNGIYNKKISDINTVFYLMRLWELDCCGHLNYTKPGEYKYVYEFLLWMDEIEKGFIKTISNNNNLSYEHLLEKYNNYHMNIDSGHGGSFNADLSKLEKEKQEYLKLAYDSYSVTYFARIGNMVDYINNNINYEGTSIKN